MSINKLFLLFFYSLLGAQSIQLNEIVSSNGSILFDEDGDSPDWIELYNPQEETVDLSGFGLSDDPEELSKWTFPEITVDPGSFLVVFAVWLEIDATSSYYRLLAVVAIVVGLVTLAIPILVKLGGRTESANLELKLEQIEGDTYRDSKGNIYRVTEKKNE